MFRFCKDMYIIINKTITVYYGYFCVIKRNQKKPPQWDG